MFSFRAQMLKCFRFFKKVYGKAGLDLSIVYTISTRILQSIGGIITLLLVTRLLNKNEQGYYYTFGSILSIQFFFEMGLTTITTQYIAHETAHLLWKNTSELSGEEYYRSRLASIVRLSIKWFLVLASLLFFVLLFAGRYFFNRYNAGLMVSWQLPWFFLSVSACFILLTDLFLAILEGLGKIKEVTRLRLIQQSVNLFFLYLLLLSDFRLLSNGLALLLSTTITGAILVYTGYFSILKKIWQTEVKWRVDYRHEILPYQFKIGIGYISSFFIYQLFNPVLFATQGPVIAGQMGATQAVLNGILAISLSWVSTKVALFSNLVARKQFGELNSIYKRNLVIAVIICFTGILTFMVLIVLLKKHYPKLSERFLDIVPIIFFSLTALANAIIFSQAYYLRSFKKEPFFVQSIVIGILSAVSTLLCSKYFGITGVSAGFFMLNGVLAFIWNCIIFKNKTYEWTGHRRYF